MAILLLVLLFCARGAEEHANASWGMASVLRSATIPYATTQNDSLLNSYVLLLYLDTPYLFLNGTEAGIPFCGRGRWSVAAYGAIHFVDMPRHDPNTFSDDTADLGVMARYRTGKWHADLLLLSDPAWRSHAKLRVGTVLERGAWSWRPYAAAEIKSAEYNSAYYGQKLVRVGADAAAEAGINTRWYLTDDIALIADAKLRYLGGEAAEAPTTDSAWQSELTLGAGIFQNTQRTRHGFDPKGYLRVAFGEATPSSFSENLLGEGVRDKHGLYLLSLFYGLPLSKRLFGAPIRTYFAPGFVHHFANDLQPPAQEYVGAFKFYYRPPHWWLRFGFGTGLSYITRTTYIERSINAKDGYDHTSHLLQYLDFSFDFELCRLFGSGWKALWFGYALHHRSGVFESAHQYGQIKGGSNYNTFYLQLHFGE
ncbi:MipA/OmpV family protein [Sulfurimonas sp. HSL-3221]|uniref:MipA/OmpV family protein n=1 Tax=Thiomicrolovo sulfuroxydans TaxID=2894755 RepID=UPI001E3B6C5D|nr:MipA/OmpV family protein [Sulfurimonas sp. HSL-3221]UFS62357.1 MipA/OmpV family protein [Sulfurimonas sp. HSL-3221]